MKRTHVCPKPGCPHLSPCPVHPPRPDNASWSSDRDTTAQGRFRKQVLARDGYQCTRCQHPDPTGRTLVAHHVRPGYQPSAGITLCRECHEAVDANAR